MRGFSAGWCAVIEGRPRRPDCAAMAAPLVVFLTAASARAGEALRGVDASPASLPDVAGMQSNVRPIAVACLAALLAVIAVVLHLAARRRWRRRSAHLEAELASARAKLDRAALSMQDDRQIVICWDRPDAEPSLEGDLALVADEAEAPPVLDYASWLGDAAAAQVLEASKRLLGRGEILLDLSRQPARAAS